MLHSYGLGIPQQAVWHVQPDSRWPRAFAAEARRIARALANIAVSLEHVGSTAIPGLGAKPIVDIMMGVTRLRRCEAYSKPLAPLGYCHLPKKIAGDHIFSKGEPQSYMLHIVQKGGYRWSRMLTFRDRLRQDPGLAERYMSLKAELAERYPEDRDAYARGKTDFVNFVVGAELSSQD